MNKVVDGVGTKVSLHDVFIAPDVGYFSAWVALQDYPSLKGVSGLPVDVRISPVIQSAQRPHNISLDHPAPPLAQPAFADFSGIERMGVSLFMSKVKAELGQEPTGKRVSVGVTDTGVTYAHPAFRNEQSGASRVTYMKDFTAEGAGFISQQAKISVARIEKIRHLGRPKLSLLH